MHDRALLIDGLGTLVALQPPAPHLARELATRFGASVSEAEAGRALRAEIGYYRAHMDSGRDAASVARLRRACAGVLRDALPRGAVPADLDAMTEVLLASLRFDAFEDARGALLAARSHGAAVIVVSNWDVSLIEVLERVGLAPLLHGVVTSAAVGARKPSAAIFEHALALAGVGPQRARHVGDTFDEDVVGARACGLQAVLLSRGGVRRAGVTTIVSLAEL
ncbi:MAG: HAD-IA family hydrolase [Solirubrobacterales bacterium]|nr:HAD-IA family hydrolase [Solirubrobacterales bacterium]